MQNISDLLAMAILVLSVFVLILLVFWLWRGLRKVFRRSRPNAAPLPKEELPENGIVVDGSNVMYWSGDPETRVLRGVIDKLKELGFQPFVVFDASVGYRLSDRYLDDVTMAAIVDLPASQVLVVHKGQIADEVILMFAKESGYRVVTNDRFRDWSVEFPLVREKGRLLKGTWREGNAVLHGL